MKEIIENVISEKHKRKYDVWKNLDVSYEDERKTYCMFYEQIIDGFKELENCHNLLIHLGFIETAMQQVEILDYIIEKYEGENND